MGQMKVTSQTSIQELHRFMQGAGNDKIRGRDNGDGTYTLYTSNKGDGTGFKNFFGMLDGRRQAANDAINMVMQRVDQGVDIATRTQTGYQQDVRGLGGGHQGTWDIRGAQVRTVVDLGEQLFRTSGASMPSGVHVDGQGNLTGQTNMTHCRRPGGRMTTGDAIKDGGDGILAKSTHQQTTNIGGQQQTFNVSEVSVADLARMNITLNGRNTNCSGLHQGTQAYDDKVQQGLTDLRTVAGSDQAATVLSSVLNQNTLNILTRGLEAPNGDMISLLQQKPDGLGPYNYRDSNGTDHPLPMNNVKQFSGANMRVTTEPNGDFRVSIDWQMHFNTARAVDANNNGTEMRLTPHDDHRFQLSHTTGEFIISKQDADRGVLNLLVVTPFTCSFDGNVH